MIRHSAAKVLTFAAVGGSFILTGCKDDLVESGGYDGRPKDSYSVSIALAGMGEEQTRAEDDGWEGGTDEESYIDINDLYVMTFSIKDGETVLSNDSELLEVLWNGNTGKSKGSGIHYSGNTAYLHTWLDHNISDYKPTPGKDFCLVAIANFKQFKKSESPELALNKNMRFGDLQAALKYDFEPNTKINDEWYWRPYKEENGKRTKTGIPLFGVKRVNLKKYDKSVHNFANPFLLMSNGSPTLWMQRAFAKVEVELHPDLYDQTFTTTEINILSASVDNRYAAQFFVIPELERMGGFANGEFPGETGAVTKTPTEKLDKSDGNKTLQFSVREEKKSAFVYLPESYLGMTTGDAVYITLTLQIGDKTKELAPFSIKKYPEASSTATREPQWQYLFRNHIYRFRVGLEKVFSVEPLPWTAAFDNEFTFGTPPTEGTEPEQPEQTEQEEN